MGGARSARDVLLFVPNLIGYTRVALSAVAMVYGLNTPTVFLALYWVAFLFDAADGYAARTLGQSSQFGAVLDMVTDRVATNALVTLLALLHPTYAVHFIALCALDLASHWFRMYASLLGGATSHKNADAAADGALVTLYYTNRIVLGTVCLVNELFYVALYCCHWPALAVVGVPLAWACAPLFALKQYLNVVQLYNSCVRVAQHDADKKGK